MPDSLCSAAIYYWEKNKNYWGKVRRVWADYLNQQSVLSLQMKVEGKMLHVYLFELAKEYAAKKITEADIDNRIKVTIARFMGLHK